MTNTKRMIIKIIAATIIMIAAFGCGGGGATKIVVAQGYKKQFAINANIAVVILDQAPEIIYYGDLKKSLVAAVADNKNTDKDVEPEVFAWNYFTDRIVQDILKEIDVKDAFISTVNNNYLITKDVVITRDEDVTLEIPDIGTRFTFDTADVALVLFLDKIRIGTETDPYYQERAQQGLYTTIARKLICISSFVLWDNRELKPICYGRVKTTTPIIREEATIANWEEVSRDFVRAMFEPTGFRKRGS